MIDNKDEIVEYSISPRTGRIKKKIRYRKRKSIFSRKKMNKYFQYLLLILFFALFVLSVVLLIRPGDQDKNRIDYIEKKGKK
jgi:hypothetical protein